MTSTIISLYNNLKNPNTNFKVTVEEQDSATESNDDMNALDAVAHEHTTPRKQGKKHKHSEARAAHTQRDTQAADTRTHTRTHTQRQIKGKHRTDTHAHLRSSYLPRRTTTA
jgi:hypothetical protein